MTIPTYVLLVRLVRCVCAAAILQRGSVQKMPDFCAAVGCAHQRNANTKQQGITFHRFPKDKVKRQLWKVALRRRDFEPNDRSVVCSCHFKAEDFDRTGQTTRIREGAIPSVFVFTRHRGEAASTARTSRTSQKAAGQPLQVQVHVTTEPTESDHQYALDLANVKKRLNEAREKLEELRRNLRNAKDRERRHKKTVKSLLEDLKHKHVLSEELQQRLGDILMFKDDVSVCALNDIF